MNGAGLSGYHDRGGYLGDVVFLFIFTCADPGSFFEYFAEMSLTIVPERIIIYAVLYRKDEGRRL
jgi:hypothetical protein